MKFLLNRLKCMWPLVFFVILLIILFAVICWQNTKSKIDNFQEQHLIVLGWAINKDHKKMKKMSKMFLDTAKKHNVDARLLGLGYDYAKWETPVSTPDCKGAGKGLQRFHVLLDYLEKENLPNDQVIVVMDAADTLVTGTGKEILQEYRKSGADILISAEKFYTYQYPKYRNSYENITPNDYKYINAGTFIGTVKAVREMIEATTKLGCQDKNSGLYGAVEMGVMGAWIADNINETNKIKLDYNNDIFWVTTDDKQVFYDAIDSNDSLIKNSNTDTYPKILHIMGAYGRDRMKDAYEKIMKT